MKGSGESMGGGSGRNWKGGSEREGRRGRTHIDDVVYVVCLVNGRRFVWTGVMELAFFADAAHTRLLGLLPEN